MILNYMKFYIYNLCEKNLIHKFLKIIIQLKIIK